MSDLKFSDNLTPLMHPAVRNYGPDTPYDWDQEPWLRIVSENRSEQLGCSVNEAKTYIKRNAPNDSPLAAEWTRPRNENIPFSRLVSDGDS